jgi:uncharacterized membrane protein (TIGR01666 family)
MKQTREISHFLHSQYFADGLRITFGTLLPALVFSYYGNLQTGIAISLGALVTSIPDTPGPVNHRRNAMLITVVLVFFAATLTKLVSEYPLLLGVEIVVLSFLFSMFSVYGNRASSVGSAGILIMILNMEGHGNPDQNVFQQTLYIVAGSIWYTLLSLTLTQFRPYRLAQQSLAVSIRNIASYLRVKADFYAIDKDADESYRKLIEQQILAHEHQDEVRELLFRGKVSVKDTTKIGRLLILIFSDMIDLFEQSMATHYDYHAIRKTYGDTGVLNTYRLVIIRLANELDNLSYYINANQRPKPLYNFNPAIEKLKAAVDEVERQHGLNTLPLKKILINIRAIAQRIDNIYKYFSRNASYQPQSDETDLSKFITHQRFDAKIFRNNLTLESNLFRHALRMSCVMGIGYLLSHLLPLGHHSYWILLTILVILKPGFSLSKQRNYQRLAGTVIGGIGGVLILLLVRNETALFVTLMAFMVLTFSFIRLNYIVGVIFMTPYILILFNFLGLSMLTVARERILDTLIGSFLAFASSYIIFPSWERKQVQGHMRKLLISNYRYLAQALQIIAGKPLEVTAYKLARKEVYVDTANMASVFQRMITEPKNKQKNSKDLNKFVVFNHILSSYSVTLLQTVKQADNQVLTSEHVRLLRRTLTLLAQSIRLLPDESDDFQETDIAIPENLDENNIPSEDIVLIKEQLEFLKRIAGDIQKVTEKMLPAAAA